MDTTDEEESKGNQDNSCPINKRLLRIQKSDFGQFFKMEVERLSGYSNEVNFG